MKHDRLHDLKGVPPIPAKHDEKAAFILQAIEDLAGLLQGGAGITCRIAEARANAAAHPRKKHLDLVRVNEHADSAATLHRVASNLMLANIAATDPGTLDESRLIRDLAFIRAAFTRMHVDGECEIDHPSDPRHAPAHVSAADDLEEAGGAYVRAWVWVPLDEVDAGHIEDAAHDLNPA
ncbi:hypothetical protein MAL1_00002 [Bacteriophage DSS3_MAL1]|nr:hypothetical protein MAL1_00002 [Bacteriophage DSS3_MAL1]